MKVVINKCFGGFSISKEAAEFMAARGNKTAKEELEKYEDTLRAFNHYRETGEPLPERYAHESVFFDIYIKYGSQPEFYGYGGDEDYERNDPDLVAAVEALGDRANGSCARLGVVEIPDGTDYEISEYDGSEHIAERHRTWS